MLRTRLFLSLLPFVVIILATGAYAIVLFSRLTTTVDAAVAEHYRSVVTAQQMILALAGIDREAWTATGTTKGNVGQVFAEHQRQFEEGLAQQLKNNSLPGARELNQQLATNYLAYRQALANLGTLTNSASRHKLYEREVTPGGLRLVVVLNKILDLNQRAILATGAQVQNITHDVIGLMAIGMGIALLMSVFASYQLSRAILRPIQLVTKSTRALGEGTLNEPVPVISRDELGELARAFNKMAEQLREYRQSTSEEIVRLHRTTESTLASFPDPIFVLNKAGRIELKNPAAADLAASLHLGDELPARLQVIARTSLTSGEDYLPHSFDHVVSYRVNGAEKFLLPRVLPMRNKENALFGVAVVLYDVTRFRLLDAAKTHLVATVSHELKTPLTSVRMALHILLEKTVGPLGPRQDELLQAACTDTERLLGILNNLLDLARLEEGNADLHRENVAPAELLQAAMDRSAAQAAAQGLHLQCSVDPELPPVLVDRQRIGHVFANLVTNAIKHSPTGSEILLRAGRADDAGVEFSVTDAGPGIAPEYQARIFDRFFRAPGHAGGGAGLGLSIAKEIVVAHGGRIGVQSEPKRGSRFYVVLKAADGNA